MGMFGKKPTSTGNDDLDRVLSRGKHGNRVTKRELKNAAEQAKSDADQRRTKNQADMNAVMNNKRRKIW